MKKWTLTACAAAFLVTGCESTPTTPEPATASVTISEQAATVGRNETLALTLMAQSSTGATTDVTQEAAWSSSNETVATVSGGVVTVRALGTAQISATYGGRVATSAVTGRRRTAFDARFEFVDADAAFSIGGARLYLDGQEVSAIGASGWDDNFYITAKGSQTLDSVEPGTHTLELLVELREGSHRIRVSATELVIQDRDTGQRLEAIRLGQKTGTIVNGERFAWQVTVPSFVE